ncbi:MAG: acetyl esterase/lipase [Candidatus Pelagisphaera sp.]|jgi:acetyl esterase/lipase
MKALFPLLLSILAIHTLHANEHVTIDLWPDGVPNQSEPKEPPLTSFNSQGVPTAITKVTAPSLTVYKPDPSIKNKAAIIICPGGAYNRLAINSEGSMVAERFSQLGYTTFVLQYRVPKNQDGALQDAQRAIRYVRSHSKEFDIDADKIGILGFSAGGSLSARVSTRYLEKVYDPVDLWDHFSARPDFSILIYPAYLDRGPKKSLTPELTIDERTPPMFLFVAADDRFVNSSLVMSSALNAKKVPFELHILPEGGHGFGLKTGHRAAETWPKLCETWLNFTVLKITQDSNR